MKNKEIDLTDEINGLEKELNSLNGFDFKSVMRKFEEEKTETQEVEKELVK